MDFTVRAHDLPGLLGQAPPGLAVLSLDCFDTLIWRNVNAPVDVFADLDLPGGALETRVLAEARARRLAPLREKGREEVTLSDIYEQMMPGEGRHAERAAMLGAELEAEARHCFAFAPVRDLIADARRRGMQVIIVSDTYLHEPQLRALITKVGGVALSGMIDRIFCSCDHGVSKAGGLFTHVLAALGVSPGRIVHVGDNRVADHDAPRKLGITGVHFHQFDDEAVKRLRFEAAAASMVAPETRVGHATFQPHRPQIALRRNAEPAFALGHDVLGPIMTAFAGWVRQEARAMEERVGRPVKLLFMLRDGHLPSRVFRLACPEMADRAIDVELSRFVANAVSFSDAAQIRTYAEMEITRSPVDMIARQLLFPKDEAARQFRGVGRRDFLDQILKHQMARKIVGRSEQFAQRLFGYLRRQGVADGDAVMLVDLGYDGSVQNRVEAVLRRGMGLEVSGRYLLMRETQLSGLDKAGYIDARNYGVRLVHALTEYVVLLEQFCTLAQGSVVDYRDDGTPVHAKAGIKGEQSDCRDSAQAGAVAFAKAADRAWVQRPKSDDADSRRHMAVAALARLLFLPLASEVEMLKGFHHDANLGTDDTFRIVDDRAAGSGLRRRGLFYAAKAEGLYLPGELQPHGLYLNLALMTARCFGLSLSKSDLEVGATTLPVFLVHEGTRHPIDVEAVPTVDGYYHAMIPVGAARFAAGIRIGEIAEWLQIEEASFHPVEQAMATRVKDGGIEAKVSVQGMAEVSPGLFHAANADGVLLYDPPARKAESNLVLSLVFRPVVRRDAATAAGASKKAA
jgi:FMN phosphatase YigB (HAD superfamily)